jgi:hypothetical protein
MDEPAATGHPTLQLGKEARRYNTHIALPAHDLRHLDHAAL